MNLFSSITYWHLEFHAANFLRSVIIIILNREAHMKKITTKLGPESETVDIPYSEQLDVTDCSTYWQLEPILCWNILTPLRLCSLACLEFT